MNFKIFTQTVECQNWGWNTITISFLAAILITIIQGWGIWKQNKKIWKNQSGKSLSLIFFVFQFSYFTSYFVYGIDRDSLTIIVNNILGLLFIPIIIGLIRYKLKEKELSRRELIISSLLPLIIPGTLLIKDKDLFLIIILGIAAISVAPQVLELIKTKETKNIEPKFIIVFLISGTLWLIYGLAINSLALITSSIPTILLSLMFLILYFSFNKKSPPY